MLRTCCLPRFKIVCIDAAYVPRIFRGEQWITAGQFEILPCAAIRKSPKYSKATGNQGALQKTESKPLLEKNTEVRNTKEYIKPLAYTQKVRETQFEKCQRIIKQTLRKKRTKEPELAEQYFSHGLNIEQTRLEIDKSERQKLAENMITDDRTHFVVFKTVPELEDEPEELWAKESMVRVEPKCLDTDTGEDLILIKPTLNVHLMSATFPDDLITETANNKEQINENLSLEETITNEDTDKYVESHEHYNKMLHETYEQLKENVAHTIDIHETRNKLGEPYVINERTSKIPVLESKTNHSILKKPSLPNTAEMDSQVFTNHLHPHLRHNAFVPSTAKEKQEQLTQNVEHIQETPLVAPQKQSNVTPRLLGELESDYGRIKCKHLDGMSRRKSSSGYSSSDEIVKYLVHPFRQLDEPLLNELEKIGISITCQNAQISFPLIEDDRVQMNILRSYTKLDQFEENETVAIYSDKICPVPPRITEKLLPGKDAEAEELAVKLTDSDKGGDSLTMYPSHIYIDKNYDRGTLITKLRPNVDTLEAKSQEVKEREIYNPQTKQDLQVNSAQIPPIIKEITPTFVTELSPKSTSEAGQTSPASKPEEPHVTKSWNFFAKPGYRCFVQTDTSALHNKHHRNSKGMNKPS
ncbi:hypothetical protein HF086_002496 [Spodoptera exigua]|uniref:Uncharacterized protein n=1 Tax=Spodoptera exigua TaxID=7107 RepID=A0A922MLX1_SPOEX|nr:hypothetical protein HF086_002496 [Spodoptera exigua]